jgi:hypothetical protein
MPSRSHRLVLLIGLLLTIIAISRVARIRTYALDIDEEYTLWATVGTAQQIIVWTPSSETSTHYLLFAAWQRLFGMEPMLIRFLVALLSLLASAIMYRAVRRMHGETAGIMTMLVYAAVGFNMFLTLYARGYFISVVAVPLAFWLTVRYFAKPAFRRALPLALSLFAMYAGQVTTVPTFGIIGLYTLLVYGRRIWLWWLPGLLALVPAAFEIIASGKLRLVGQRTSVGLPPVGFYLPDAVWRFFSYFVGVGLVPLIWLGLAILAFVLLLRSRTRIAWLWAALTITIPIALYYLETRLGFYEFKRYAWWYIVPLALWLGIALAQLSPLWSRVVAVLLLALMLLPYPINTYSYFLTPLNVNLRWLSQHLEPGDVVMLEPNQRCATQESWELYKRMYFPNGIHFVEDPTGYRRVWFVTSINTQDQRTEQALRATRWPGEFVGPPECLFRVYEAPPDVQGVLFENGMRFHGAQYIFGDGRSTVSTSEPLALRYGEAFRVRLWWSVDRPVTYDYSVGLYMYKSDTRFLATDSPPQLIFPADAPRETSRWQTGRYYVEERTFQLPAHTGEVTLSAELGLYWFEDLKLQQAPGVNGRTLLPLRGIYVRGWF